MVPSRSLSIGSHGGRRSRRSVHTICGGPSSATCWTRAPTRHRAAARWTRLPDDDVSVRPSRGPSEEKSGGVAPRTVRREGVVSVSFYGRGADGKLVSLTVDDHAYLNLSSAN